jgi:serine/threonine protein kinase
MATNVTELERRADVPAKIGKYVIINKVGKGSTGNVYLSHDPYYRRDVAIKVYNIEEDSDADRARVARKMFYNEAHMVGMLQHPNIMPIYDAGEEDGKYYVVTEHIQGARTLAAYCRPDNLLRIDDVVELIYKCAKALHYSHSRGVIHRDIKPSNVMLTNDNDVRIIDFGIAIVSDSEVSRIEGIAGSPSYMSPEQVQSEELTPRSDLYSLGAVLYELLTGFRPFRADNLSKLLHQIVYATPPPIHTYRDDIPEELEEVVAMSMQKDPGKRCSSGAAMAADLTRVYQDLRTKYDSLDNQEHFDLLRNLTFFHEFSHAEIWEVLRASDWHEYKDGEDIVREGEMDDLF